MKITDEFVSREPNKYQFSIGHVVASSLAGFLTGLAVASVVWGAVFWITKFIIAK